MGAAAGLVTAIVAGVVAAVFGGSHLQVSGPTGAMTVVLLPVTAKHGVATVPLLAILAGLLVIAMALTAVGRAVEFIPVSVVEGFTIGIGVIIGLQQLPLILGTERGEAESTLVSSWLTLGATDWTRAWQPLVVAAGVIALHLVGHRFFRHLPLSLIAIVVATGAIARTAVNVRSGARTRLASVSHAVVLLLVMLLLAPLVSRIPMAALGGVLLVTAGRMINLRLVRTLTHVTRADRNTFWLTLGATVLLDLVAAVLLGIGMAALMSLRHMASYSVVARQNLPTNTREGDVDFSPGHEHLRPRVAIFRVDGALFYGDARRFVDEVTAVDEATQAVILRCHRMRILDASGADAIKAVARQLRARDIVFVVQGMTESQQRTCRLMRAFDEDCHVRELSQAVTRVERDLASRV